MLKHFPFFMDYLLICLVALLGSGLTLFSGFGLGTLLLPAFGIFFPIPMAIALTAIVHFLNNLFKLALLGRHAEKKILLHFGVPAILASFAGAYLLHLLDAAAPLYVYEINGKLFEVTAMKLCIAAIILFFALFDTIPRLAAIQFDTKYLAIGGLLSGFFGGISGNQGALRSAFLIRANLSKEVFIGTGVVIACFIDISRLAVYSRQTFSSSNEGLNYPLLLAATLSAFAGAYFGNKLLKKITIKSLQYFVAAALIIFSLLLGAGII